jgi:hypothetical protein
MNYRAQRFATWAGLVGLVVAGTGQFTLLGMLPPLHPSWSAAQVAEYYRTRQDMILAGAICLQCGFTALMFFFMSLAVFIRKIEGTGRLWTYTYLGGSVVANVQAVLAYAFFTANALRASRPDDLFLLMNDLSTLLLMAIVAPAWLQFGIMGFAILGDRRSAPVFPRWVGYLNLFAAAGSLPSAFVGYFIHGPFAWNGLIGFWISAAVFGIWMFVMIFQSLKAVGRLQQEDAAITGPMSVRNTA